MSNAQPDKPAAPERPIGPPAGQRRGPGGGGPFGGMGMPAEKSQNFLTSGKRLLGRLRPDRMALTVVIVLGVIAVALNVVGPKILGQATTLIYTAFYTH
jgi:ATP-binding cassette subfamily B multidrug efflux pump